MRRVCGEIRQGTRSGRQAYAVECLCRLWGDICLQPDPALLLCVPFHVSTLCPHFNRTCAGSLRAACGAMSTSTPTAAASAASPLRQGVVSAASSSSSWSRCTRLSATWLVS